MDLREQLEREEIMLSLREISAHTFQKFQQLKTQFARQNQIINTYKTQQELMFEKIFQIEILVAFYMCKTQQELMFDKIFQIENGLINEFDEEWDEELATWLYTAKSTKIS